jgi:hypothetical protein
VRAPIAPSLLLAAFFVAGCADPAPTPTPSPSIEAPTEAPSETPASRCPAFAFDATASLGPTFDEEIFVKDEETTIGAAFVKGLSDLYQGDPGEDPCALFTASGLDGALALDPRLGPALAGAATLDTDLVFRLAGGGGTYDLRQRPPRVPIDVVFDIPEGTTTTDLVSGATDTSLDAVRVFLRVTFAYDGSRWLADRVERTPSEETAPFALPKPVTSLKACKGFHADPDGAPFDDHAGSRATGGTDRRWCADGGKGGALPAALVNLWTRWPCQDTRIAVLTLGLPLMTPDDQLDRHQYIRDPLGEAMDRGWITERWKRGVKLPEDAEDTGWTNGNMDIWLDDNEVEQAIYVRTDGRYERWPRATDPSVTDCN